VLILLQTGGFTIKSCLAKWHSDMRQRGNSRLITGISLSLAAVLHGALTLIIGAYDYNLASIWSSLPVVLLNLLPPLLMSWLLYYIIGHAFIASSVSGAAFLTVAFINHFKTQSGREPLSIGDFRISSMQMFTEIMNQTPYRGAGASYKFIIRPILIVAVVLFIGSLLWLMYYATAKPGKKSRFAGSAVTITLTVAVMFFVYGNKHVYAAIFASDAPVSEQPICGSSYEARGFVYPLLYSAFESENSDPVEPPGFEEEMFTIEPAIAEPGIIEKSRQVNVISIMLESYCDIESLAPGLELQPDVYAGLRALQAETLHGTLAVNIFGGGTCNTERAFLTGFFTIPEIAQPIPSYVRLLSENGYYTEGFHPFDRDFYNRAEINPYLGFDNYYYLDDYEDADVTDEYFFNKILENYRNRDPEIPYFSHNLSMQNHGGYLTDENYGEGIIAQNELTDETYNILSNYLVGIADTSDRMLAFCNELRYDPEPVIVLIYGDHKPWLGPCEAGYEELGVNMDETTEDGFYNHYTTPYIIWANDAAKNVLGQDFSDEMHGAGKTLSPSFLMNYLFELCSWDGGEYMNKMNELFNDVTVVNTATGLFLNDGSLLYSLPEDAAARYNAALEAEYMRKLTVIE